MSREEASDQVRSAVELAQKRGARIVGLGAFTSVVTQGGLAVSKSGLAITTGNSYTAVASLAAIRLALRERRQVLTEPVVAIVGAAGAIGGAMAVLIAEDASRLILVGNPLRSHQHNRTALLRVAGEVCRHVAVEASRGYPFRHGTVGNKIVTMGCLPSADASPESFVALAEQLERDHGLFFIARDAAGALPLAEVVILATSATTAILKHYHLRQNALVCDVSRPKNVGPDVLRKRPDVLVLDGGVIDIPGKPEIGPFDLDRGQAYACMAETMMLALEQRYEHMSLGANLSPEGLLLMRQLAGKHGFAVASFRTFARPLPSLAAFDSPPADADDNAIPKLDGPRAVA
jgi:predicted amino acid dehydrogenase